MLCMSEHTQVIQDSSATITEKPIRRARTHLEYARPTNAPACAPPRTSRSRYAARIERAFPRLEPALVCTRDEVSRRIDKGRNSSLSLFVSLAQREPEAHIEEVPSRECVTAASGCRVQGALWANRECSGAESCAAEPDKIEILSRLPIVLGSCRWKALRPALVAG
jgi:hypothetical protein